MKTFTSAISSTVGKLIASEIFSKKGIEDILTPLISELTNLKHNKEFKKSKYSEEMVQPI